MEKRKRKRNKKEKNLLLILRYIQIYFLIYLEQIPRVSLIFAPFMSKYRN